MIYKEPEPVGKLDVEAILAGGDAERIMETLVALALNESDWQFVQDKCLACAGSSDASIRSVSATCLGHLARIHGKLDLAKVLPVLAALGNEPETAGFAENAMDDIRKFIKGVGEVQEVLKAGI